MIDKKRVKQVTNDILTINRSIIIGGCGILLMQGNIEDCKNSFAFMLRQLYQNERKMFDEVMKEFEKIKDKK